MQPVDFKRSEGSACAAPCYGNKDLDRSFYSCFSYYFCSFSYYWSYSSPRVEVVEGNESLSCLSSCLAPRTTSLTSRGAGLAVTLLLTPERCCLLLLLLLLPLLLPLLLLLLLLLPLPPAPPSTTAGAPPCSPPPWQCSTPRCVATLCWGRGGRAMSSFLGRDCYYAASATTSTTARPHPDLTPASSRPGMSPVCGT